MGGNGWDGQKVESATSPHFVTKLAGSCRTKHDRLLSMIRCQ
jgi:hypothetical protein